MRAADQGPRPEERLYAALPLQEPGDWVPIPKRTNQRLPWFFFEPVESRRRGGSCLSLLFAPGAPQSKAGGNQQRPAYRLHQQQRSPVISLGHLVRGITRGRNSAERTEQSDNCAEGFQEQTGQTRRQHERRDKERSAEHTS